MTQLQRIMVMSFIAETIGGFNEILPDGASEVLMEVAETELDDIGDDQDIREEFTKMAKDVYEEIVKEEEGA